MDEEGRVVDFYIATKTMVTYSALMGKQIAYCLLVFQKCEYYTY
jgi:hypothetical protein